MLFSGDDVIISAMLSTCDSASGAKRLLVLMGWLCDCESITCISSSGCECCWLVVSIVVISSFVIIGSVPK